MLFETVRFRCDPRDNNYFDIVVLTVNAECNGCLVLLPILHGTVEDDTSIAGAVVFLRRRDGQHAGGLMVLGTATIYDGLQGGRRSLTIPPKEIGCDKLKR